jgi:hypothetical protein
VQEAADGRSEHHDNYLRNCPRIVIERNIYGFLPHFLLEISRSVGSMTIRSGMTSWNKIFVFVIVGLDPTIQVIPDSIDLFLAWFQYLSLSIHVPNFRTASKCLMQVQLFVDSGFSCLINVVCLAH